MCRGGGLGRLDAAGVGNGDTGKGDLGNRIAGNGESVSRVQVFFLW